MNEYLKSWIFLCALVSGGVLSGCAHKSYLEVGDTCESCVIGSADLRSGPLILGGSDMIRGENPEPNFNRKDVDFWTHKALSNAIGRAGERHCYGNLLDETEGSTEVWVSEVTFIEVRSTFTIEPQIDVCISAKLGQTGGDITECSGFLGDGINKWGIFGRSDQSKFATPILYQRAFEKATEVALLKLLDGHFPPASDCAHE